LVNVNAYHQPGVEAGKKAAQAVIGLQGQVMRALMNSGGDGLTVTQIAESIGAHDEWENIFHICEHLSANEDRNVTKATGAEPFSARYVVRS
jgi:glucose-6-phosphate isomerase